MASSTLNNLSAKTPATSSIIYLVNTPFGAGDDGKATLQSVSESLGIPRILYKQGLPMVYLSSGTATGSPLGTGAVTGLTALTQINPVSAYCWFPAGANVDGAATAGWYYCTFAAGTGATTCTVFNNRYTPSDTPPAIPGSPTAPTTLTSWTSDTTSHIAASFTVPAGAMGVNGMLEMPTTFFSQTNNANGKSYTVAFGAFTAVNADTLASSGSQLAWWQISNMGSASSQVGNATHGGSTALTYTSGTVNSGSSVTVTISLTKATATDNLAIWPFKIVLWSNGN